MNELSTLGFLGMAAVVAFGSFLPVLPTGPTVSAAAVLAHEERPVMVLVVVAVAAAAAQAGDLATFLALRRTGAGLGRRLPWLRVDDPDGTVRTIGARLEHRAVRVLLVGRLIPGGRVPVVLAAALGPIGTRRFLVANVPAVLAWAGMYALVGFAGGRIFADARIAIVVAVVVALVIGPLARLVRGRSSSD